MPTTTTDNRPSRRRRITPAEHEAILRRRRNPRGAVLSSEAEADLARLLALQTTIVESESVLRQGVDERRELLVALYADHGISQEELAMHLSRAGKPIGPDLVQKALRAAKQEMAEAS
jgi:hypothetical protein